MPPAILTELARPKDFLAAANGANPESIHEQVLCAADAAPVVAAIDRFVGAGYDSIYLHQIGPDQQRLADVARSDLLPHLRPGT